MTGTLFLMPSTLGDEAPIECLPPATVPIQRRLNHLVLAGRDVGVVSEAGCPAVAGPGTKVVRRAHERGVREVPMVGPSAILLALMASGMNGQRFAFQGYLPVEASRPMKRCARSSRRPCATAKRRS